MSANIICKLTKYMKKIIINIQDTCERLGVLFLNQSLNFWTKGLAGCWIVLLGLRQDKCPFRLFSVHIDIFGTASLCVFGLKLKLSQNNMPMTNNLDIILKITSSGRALSGSPESSISRPSTSSSSSGTC